MTSLQRGIKIEITKLLSSETAHIFAQWIGSYGVIWNCKVAENKIAYQQYLEAQAANEPIKKPRLDQKVAHFMTAERPWLKTVPSQIRRNAGTKYLEAMTACFRGLRKAPKFRNYSSPKNCLVTNELFDFLFVDGQIVLSFKKTNKSKAFCTLNLAKKEELPFAAPKMLWLSRQGARFWVSWSYNREVSELRSPDEILKQLKSFSPTQQVDAVLGIDVGIVIPVALSTQESVGFSQTEVKALEKKQRRRLRYQKKFSRQRERAKQRGLKPGKNYQKTQAKLADIQAHMGNIRKTMAHRVSKNMAEKAVEVVVAEKLQIQNMTKRPKAKQDPETQKWLVNGASRKAGLNKKILNVGWGRILNYTEYKLRERDKLLVRIAPYYSSQECLTCGYCCAENRKTQSEFCCVICGYHDSADHNAAKVLKKRFLEALNNDEFAFKAKTVKKIAIRKKKTDQAAGFVCGAKIRPALAGIG